MKEEKKEELKKAKISVPMLVIMIAAVIVMGIALVQMVVLG